MQPLITIESTKNNRYQVIVNASIFMTLNCYLIAIPCKALDIDLDRTEVIDEDHIALEYKLDLEHARELTRNLTAIALLLGALTLTEVNLIETTIKAQFAF